MSKHYIRIDEKNRIINGFSDDFEQQIDTDICIANDAGRQFEILGQVNPDIIDSNGILLYKYENNQVIERTTEEIAADFQLLPKQGPSEVEKVKIRVEALENVLVELI